MGTTPTGLPYPEPTDPVAQGAGAIRSLAESVDPRPKGILARSSIVSNFGPLSASAVVSNLNLNGVVNAANRAIAATFTARNIFGTPGNAGGIVWILCDGATIAYGDERWDAVGSAGFVHIRALTVPTAGAHNWAVYLDVAPSTQMGITATTVSPAWFTIEDIGSSTPPAGDDPGEDPEP